MKITANIPQPLPPPPATYTLELSEKEVIALMGLTGNISLSEQFRIVSMNGLPRKTFKSKENYNTVMNTFYTGLYYAVYKINRNK